MSKVMKSHSMMPYAPDGRAEYGDYVAAWHGLVNSATPLILHAIENGSLGDKRWYTIVDFGTADGSTGMQVLCKAIDQIRSKYGHNMDIQLFFEDQSFNDFNTLMQKLHGQDGKKSVFDQYAGLTMAACGTSFYRQCLPSNSVNLALSFTAMHWLSRNPVKLKQCIHNLDPNCTANEQAYFSRVAKEDWENILLARSKELVIGGFMVVSMAFRDEYGRFSGKLKLNDIPMQTVMGSHWLKMAQEGIISQDEFEDTNFNAYPRSEAEIKAPFQDRDSLVYKSGLRLVKMKAVVAPCAHYTSWMNTRRSSEHDEVARRAHAQRYVKTARVWSNSFFFTALSDKRETECRKKIVDELYNRYEDHVALNPEQHSYAQLAIQICLKKV